MALQDIIEQTVSGLGYQLVEVERSAGGLLRVTIDLPWQAGQPEQFVQVEDCEKVTRQLQFVLEVEFTAVWKCPPPALTGHCVRSRIFCVSSVNTST